MGEILWRLKSHADAARPGGDGDPARATGFLSFSMSADGACSVLYHWGRRSFASIQEVDEWLAGRTPASWKE